MMLPLESYHSDKYFMFCHNNWEIKVRNTAFTDQSDLSETCHDCCGLDTFIRPAYHVEGWHMGSRFPDLGHKQTVCQPRTNQINQNWPTSRIHTPESAASLPKKRPHLIYLGHIYYFTCGTFQAHIHFVRARRRPAVPRHCLKWRTSVWYLGFDWPTPNDVTLRCDLASENLLN